jgi:hypothetical protein
MRPCTTHHHACDCREAKFTELERENAKLREAGDRLATDLEGLREILRNAGYNPGWGNGCLEDWRQLKKS